MGIAVFGIRVLARGKEYIIRSSLLQSSNNGPGSVRVLSAIGVP